MVGNGGGGAFLEGLHGRRGRTLRAQPTSVSEGTFGKQSVIGSQLNRATVASVQGNGFLQDGFESVPIFEVSQGFGEVANESRHQVFSLGGFQDFDAVLQAISGLLPMLGTVGRSQVSGAEVTQTQVQPQYPLVQVGRGVSSSLR